MKESTICMAAGLLLVLAALLLTGYNLWDEQRAGQTAAQTLPTLQQTTSEAATNAEPSTEETMPTVEVDGLRYVGTIELPTLGLTLPVLETCTDANLKNAPCVYAGTAYKPGFVVAGHNYKCHFGRLDRLSVGDEAIFTDMEGRRFTYTMAEQTTLNAADTAAMTAVDWPLTLFTCASDGRQRITVRFN